MRMDKIKSKIEFKYNYRQGLPDKLSGTYTKKLEQIYIGFGFNMKSGNILELVLYIPKISKEIRFNISGESILRDNVISHDYMINLIPEEIWGKLVKCY